MKNRQTKAKAYNQYTNTHVKTTCQYSFEYSVGYPTSISLQEYKPGNSKKHCEPVKDQR